MVEHRKSADTIVPFELGGGVVPSFQLAPALARAAFITVIAVLISETLVLSIYFLVDPEMVGFHASVTLAVTVLAAFPLAMYFSLQRFQLKLALARLDLDVKYDELSGLFTRRVFDAQAPLLLEQQERKDGSVLFIDADHFKSLNDTYGHDVGDSAIEMIGKSIASMLRPGDIAGRMGGEEFCVLLPGQSAASAELTAERIAQAIRVNSRNVGIERIITVSIGMASQIDGENFGQMKKRADKSLYRAKSAGRNRIVIDVPGDEYADADPAADAATFAGSA